MDSPRPHCPRGLRRLGAQVSVRERMLGTVLVAAISFGSVAVAAELTTRTVTRHAERERTVVDLRERYLVAEVALAQLHASVYEVATTHAGSPSAPEKQESIEEYAQVRGRYDGLAPQLLQDVPRGALADSAAVLAMDLRAVRDTATEAVDAAAVGAPDVAALLAEVDENVDALARSLDTMVDDLGAVEARAVASTDAARQRASQAVLLASLVGVTALFLLAMLAAASILRGLAGVATVARRLADGDFDARFTDPRSDEIGRLGQAFNATADSLKDMMERLDEQRRQDSFGRQVNDALDMADTEEQTYDAVRHALEVVSSDHPTELLVADSSKAHLETRAQHPAAGAPGCPVESPFGCVAVRRGTTTSFPDSRALNACPKLRDRGEEPLSAVCVPVTFMGRALGVLHTTAPVDAPADAEEVSRLATVAAATGARIGTVRSFERTQLQASTDGLTGLMNRRTFETRARVLVRQGGRHAIVMADVDHFKLINDTHGHEAGDRALVLFADQLRAQLREEDLLARYGGEEFVMLLTDSSAADAATVLERFRASFALVSGLHPPAFTTSFGVVDTERADTLAGMIKRADAALYRAKAEGRDRIVLGDTAPVGGGRAGESAWELAAREDDPLEDVLLAR